MVFVEIARLGNAKDAIAAAEQICGIYRAAIEALFRAVSLPVAASDQRRQGVTRIDEGGLFGSPLVVLGESPEPIRDGPIRHVSRNA